LDVVAVVSANGDKFNAALRRFMTSEDTTELVRLLVQSGALPGAPEPALTVAYSQGYTDGARAALDAIKLAPSSTA
jgi:hypothetical protein